MQAKRENALTDLKRLAETLKNSRVVLSDKALVEELEQTCVWASRDGTKACLPDIQKRIDDISLKVCKRLILPWRFIALINFTCLSFGRKHNWGRSCWIRWTLSLFKIQPYRATWHHIKLGLVAMEKTLPLMTFRINWEMHRLRLVNMPLESAKFDGFLLSEFMCGGQTHDRKTTLHNSKVAFRNEETSSWVLINCCHNEAGDGSCFSWRDTAEICLMLCRKFL